VELPNKLWSVFIGEGTLLIQCAEIFLNAGHGIVAVVSEDPTIRRWAAERGISRLNAGNDVAESLSSRQFDYLFSVANLRILTDEIVRLPRKMAVNFHDALLPKYAGVHATSWAIMHGETRHGITWHEMTDSVDSGRILKQRVVEITTDETAFSLNTKCYEAGIESFDELVRDISANNVTLTDPQLEERTYFGKYKRPENACVLSWDRSAEELNALARALTFGPYPNPLGVPKVLLDGEAFISRRSMFLM